MMQQAELCGLRFKPTPDANPDTIVGAKVSQDRDGRLYNSRSGFGGYYRYGPRSIDELSNMKFSLLGKNKVAIEHPKIHISALQRQANGAHVYAPIGLPADYLVVSDEGSIISENGNSFERPPQALQREAQQERVWNLVWFRRLIYFATLAASFHLLLFPLIYQSNKVVEYSSGLRPISEILRLTSTFLPSIANWWIGAFATNPGAFVIGAIALALLLVGGSVLEGKIADLMNSIWSQNAQRPNEFQRSVGSAVEWYRKWTVRHWVLTAFKRYLFPLFFAGGMIYLVGALVSHLAFNFFDANGFYCRESPAPYTLAPNEERQFTFRADAFCQPTEIRVEQGYRYSVTINRGAVWTDGSYPSGISGYEVSELPTWWLRIKSFVMLPLRRVFLREWFRPIARIGTRGNDEYFIDPQNRSGLNDPQNLKVNSVFTTRRDGELFLYVNDAAIGLPWFYAFFYRHNDGESEVVVRRLPR